MQPYLDHVLTDEEMAEAEAHLAECEDCRRRYRFEESLRSLRAQGGHGTDAGRSCGRSSLSGASGSPLG